MKKLLLLTFAVIMGSVQIANASAIVGAPTPGTGTAFPPDLSGIVTPGAPVLYDTETLPGTGFDDPTGEVAFGVTALAKLRPFDANFGIIDTMAVDGIGGRVISFAVTVTNSIGMGLEEPDESGAVIGDNIQNIEFEIVGGAGHTFGAPGNADAPLVYTNGMGNEVLRFGGVRGGGPAIAVGDSRTFLFDVLTVAETGVFTLRITANPEPGSIILALIVAMTFGGYYYHQRRKQATPEAATMLA